MIDIIYLYLNNLNNYVDKYFIFSIIIFLLFIIFYISFSLPGNLIFFISSGYFFNLYIGFLINIFSIVLGSFIFFIFSKFLINSLFYKFYNNYSNKINLIVKHTNYEYLIILRLIPGPPLILQNLCLSILKISKIKFLMTTFIGFVPLMFFCAYIGSELSNFVELKNFNINSIFNFKFLIILIILILLLIIRIFFNKKKTF
tara:strand:- start:168 stop:770 length:603 start_codon:yes stop_codon:yes gene_type:complete